MSLKEKIESKKAKVAVIGLGYWGPNLARTFFELDGSFLHTCADVDESQLKKIQIQYPTVNTTTNIEEILRNPEIDAVVIATSAVTHYELAKKTLLASKHAFVEKPLALRATEAEELIRLTKKVGRVLMVGHLLEYHPAVRAIKSYIDQGEIGEISYLYAQRLNLGKIRKDENCLWSLAPHDISVILYLLEKEPQSVVAVGECYLQKCIEDVVFLTLRFPNQIMTSIHISWLDPHKVRKLTIVGTKKMIVFDDMKSMEKIRIYDKGAGPPQDYRSYGEDLTLRFGDISIPHIEMAEPLKLECLHFLDCIRNGKIPLSSGEDGLRVVKVLEAAQKSMSGGGCPVNV